MLLGKPAVGSNQRPHGQVGWETVRDVFEAALARPRGFHNGASTEAAFSFRLRGEEGDETVATQEMSAGKEFGTVEVLETHRAFHVAVDSRV